MKATVSQLFFANFDWPNEPNFVRIAEGYTLPLLALISNSLNFETDIGPRIIEGILDR